MVEKFVEYFGPGMQHLSVPDRATIANMTPEYGATLGFFPIDGKTIDYLSDHRSPAPGRRPRGLRQGQRLFLHGGGSREYTTVIDFDLTVEPLLAGPARPQDRVPLSAMRTTFGNNLSGI